ncbi:hypothetical protein HXX76_013232 [Chlamydomonas incerta]|uniref:FATC domain-containing protein n=1 Tax=Chlamydomonas incerta TaxID=51695 RepID=A0A835VR20_CHLIN|nr:hypothetical protein HXX76_013232 [Chlamydomonas incerta]|eukprot:KAG2426042.1 hypothetical protein HXX76_013232 [Chlamydomonas incerta]
MNGLAGEPPVTSPPPHLPTSSPPHLPTSPPPHLPTVLQKRRHPSLIDAEELRPRHDARPYYAALCATVDGAEAAGGDGGGEGSMRARLLQAGRVGPLSPAAQARCQLEAAADPGLLARTYLGWKPYL